MRLIFMHIKHFIVLATALTGTLLLRAQPPTDPGVGGKSIPSFFGPVVAALIIGGIIYLVLTGIGNASHKRSVEKFFKTLGIIMWILIFILFLFIL